MTFCTPSSCLELLFPAAQSSEQLLDALRGVPPVSCMADWQFDAAQQICCKDTGFCCTPRKNHLTVLGHRSFLATSAYTSNGFSFHAFLIRSPVCVLSFNALFLLLPFPSSQGKPTVHMVMLELMASFNSQVSARPSSHLISSHNCVF